MSRAMESGKKSDRQESSPFEGVQKGLVLHEVQIFSQQQINPLDCCRVLTKILYLLCQGENFTSDEATAVFFGATKLFQSNNASLRRMLYLVIRELARGQDNVFVVINCLSKDMNSSNDLFRSNAIRVFAKVLDSSMLCTMERFLKQAIVDRNPKVAAAAVIAGQQLFRIAPDTIKRWQGEIQEAVNSKDKMVQYHALALLCMVKQHDRLATSKVVTALVKRAPRSYLTQTLLLRYIVKLLRVDTDQGLMDYLMTSIRSKSSPTSIEAVRGLLSLPSAAPHQIQTAIASIQTYLGSSLAVERFAAVRILSQAVGQWAIYVATCSTDLEMMIQDPNRSIATLAVTILLKTGVESSIERLIQSIQSFMADISDDLRIVLVDAIRMLGLKFPQKLIKLMNFLSNILRDEGSLQYKKAIVNTIMTLMNALEEAKDAGLEHLCEYIEDCDYDTLAVEILHVLGEELPKTKTPARYIRYIYNRVILEYPSVRAAAIQCLAKLGAICPVLSSSCIALIKRGLNDNDDEVRDRATYCVALLSGPSSKDPLTKGISLDWSALEYSLSVYISSPDLHGVPFSLTDVLLHPAPSQPSPLHEPAPPRPTHDFQQHPDQPAADETDVALMNMINSVPEFASLGPLFKSSKCIELTEDEAEYVTTCIKHTFDHHVLLQFNITSYMEGLVLVDVTVDFESDEMWTEEMCIPSALLEYEVGGVVWLCLSRPEGQYSSPSFPAALKFSVRDADADPDDRGYEDEYQLEEFSVNIGDFLRPWSSPVVLSDFRQLWDSSSSSSESVVKSSLSYSMQEAVDDLVALLPITVVEHSNSVADSYSRTHSLNMIGEFLGGEMVMVRAGFMKPKQDEVVAKVAVRAADLDQSRMITDFIISLAGW